MRTELDYQTFEQIVRNNAELGFQILKNRMQAENTTQEDEPP